MASFIEFTDSGSPAGDQDDQDAQGHPPDDEATFNQVGALFTLSLSLYLAFAMMRQLYRQNTEVVL